MVFRQDHFVRVVQRMCSSGREASSAFNGFFGIRTPAHSGRTFRNFRWLSLKPVCPALSGLALGAVPRLLVISSAGRFGVTLRRRSGSIRRPPRVHCALIDRELAVHLKRSG
jgi:hypothetical protein